MYWRQIAVLATALVATQAAAKPKPKPIDLSPVAKHFSIYHDGHGHFLVVGDWLRTIRDRKLEKKVRMLFYGNGKVFYRQVERGFGGDTSKQQFSIYVADPRVGWAAQSMFRIDKGAGEMECQGRKTALVRLSPAETATMLKRARFFSVAWQRMGHFLARDDDGIYYFVDRYDSRGSTPFELGGFRLFSGPRGKLKRLPLDNIVADPAGEIFISKMGKLKVSKDGKAAWWVTKKATTKLVGMSPRSPQVGVFIFRDLGVYFGQRLHRPCDDM